MLDKQELLDEARKQKQALAVIGVWRGWLFTLTTLFFILSVFALRGAGVIFILGVVSAILTAVCLTLLLLVNLSIRNGHRNVEKMLDSLKS